MMNKDQITSCVEAAPNEGAPQHPDAKYVGDEYNGLSGGGDYEIWDCPHCGRRLYIQLPD